MRATVVTHRAPRQMSFRADVQLLVYRRPAQPCGLQASRRPMGSRMDSDSQAASFKREDARPVQSFGAWRCMHWGTPAANTAAAGAALVFFLGDPRLPGPLRGAPRKAQSALSTLAATPVHTPRVQSTSDLRVGDHSPTGLT